MKNIASNIVRSLRWYRKKQRSRAHCSISLIYIEKERERERERESLSLCRYVVRIAKAIRSRVSSRRRPRNAVRNEEGPRDEEIKTMPRSASFGRVQLSTRTNIKEKKNGGEGERERERERERENAFVLALWLDSRKVRREHAEWDTRGTGSREGNEWEEKRWGNIQALPPEMTSPRDLRTEADLDRVKSHQRAPHASRLLRDSPRSVNLLYPRAASSPRPFPF